LKRKPKPDPEWDHPFWDAYFAHHPYMRWFKGQLVFLFSRLTDIDDWSARANTIAEHVLEIAGLTAEQLVERMQEHDLSAAVGPRSLSSVTRPVM
jgi:hypothetical protein